MTRSAEIKQKLMDMMKEDTQYAVQEMKDYLSSSDIKDYTEGQFAGVINNLVKNGTIKKVERGVYMLANEKKKKCFVVSPIGDEGSNVRKQSDQLFNHIIKPVCEKCEFEVTRIDYETTPDSITQGILDSLKNYDLVIADLTGHNPNVFFEMGYRTSTGKPIIHLKQKGEKIPFDVSTIRTFEYDLTDLDIVEDTRNKLECAILSYNYENFEDETGESETVESQKISIVLNEILYRIEALSEEVKNKEQENIKTIIEACSSMQPRTETTEAQMMKILLPELLKNPSKIDSLIALQNKLK